MCGIIRVGERLHKVWGTLDQNAGFHGNRKPPLTYNGKNDVTTFSGLLLTRSLLYMQVMRTCIKSQTSLNFSQILSPTTEYLKNSNRLIMEKWCLHVSAYIFDQIIIKVAGNRDRHKSFGKLDF